MDWANIGSIIAALVFAVGLPLALKKRKKGSPQKCGAVLASPSGDRNQGISDREGCRGGEGGDRSQLGTKV